MASVTRLMLNPCIVDQQVQSVGAEPRLERLHGFPNVVVPLQVDLDDFHGRILGSKRAQILKKST